MLFHPFNAFKGDPMIVPWAVQLHLGGFSVVQHLSERPLCLYSQVLKHLLLTNQVKAWNDLDSYSSSVQADPRSAADERANKLLETITVHDAEQYSRGMLWATDNVTLPNNFYGALVQFKLLEQRLEKEPELKSIISRLCSMIFRRVM